MAELWFVLVALMLTVYVVLDGFDLGAGALHVLVARTDEERRRVLSAIGPFWDGNEVWLLAGAGTLVFAFPRLYAASFSGFFLPLMVVLWLLMGRGIAIEFRSHVESEVWRSFWDAVFAASSLLLAIFLGAALGNVVRGVPLDASGTFFEPFFTDFRASGQTGILDWYTVLAGLLALASLSHHGALWLVWKTDGALAGRARRAAALAFAATAGLLAATTWATFRVQPWMQTRFAAAPWGLVFPASALLGLVGSRVLLARHREAGSFLASAVFLAGLLAATAFGLFPNVLPSSLDGAHALTVRNAAGPDAGLRTALLWWGPGMALVCAYTAFVYWRFRGKVA